MHTSVALDTLCQGGGRIDELHGNLLRNEQEYGEQKEFQASVEMGRQRFLDTARICDICDIFHYKLVSVRPCGQFAHFLLGTLGLTDLPIQT